MEGLNDIKKLQEELNVVNQKLLNAEKVKSDFLSNIKNEINNPLTSILGLLKVATNNPADLEGNKSIIDMIYKEVFNLNFQMRNILSAAEIEAGQAVINISKFNLRELFDQVVNSLSAQDKEYQNSVDIKIDENESFACDKEKISIIVANLLSNALKFSKNSKNVLLETTHDSSDNLIITIKDFGVGISKEDLATVFDRFKQLDSGTRKAYGGHGLGLAVVHSLVSMLNGTFTLESNEGDGTTFIVTIPPIGDLGAESVFYDDDEGILFGNDEGEEEIF